MRLELLWVVVRLVAHLSVVGMRYFVKDFVMQIGYGRRLFAELSYSMKGMFLSRFEFGHLDLRSVNSMLHGLLG